MTNDQLRRQLGELVDAARGLVDLLTDEHIEPASSPPAPWPERLGYPWAPNSFGYSEPIDPERLGRPPSPAGKPVHLSGQPTAIGEFQALVARLRHQLEAERNGRATDAQHHRIVSLELADAHKLIASLENTVTELRDQRFAATRRVAELTEQINESSMIVDLNGGPDWRPYEVELDANGEPPRIVNGTLVGRWRPNDGAPGGEVWVQYTPGDMDHPGTGSRYVVTLPISPPDTQPQFVPGADRTDPED